GVVRALRPSPTRRSSDLTSWLPPPGAALTRWFVCIVKRAFEGLMAAGQVPSDAISLPPRRSCAGDARARRCAAPTCEAGPVPSRSEEHTSELQSRENLVC